MASEATQKNRSLAIETTLGPDALLLRSVSLQEQIARPFAIEVGLRSENAAIAFDDIVGTNATVRLEAPDQETRYLNGVISRFAQTENRGKYAQYEATLVPWLWLLTRTADCRIFQNKTIPAILEDVFKGHGLNDYELKLSESYAELEYCVQYRETDFNFVSRLMEQEGIYYYFTHENGRHVMVIADAISAHAPFPGYEEVAFRDVKEHINTDNALTDWQVEKVVQPGAFALNDFDFTKPKSSLRTNASMTRNHAAAGFEMYDYPGEYLEHGDGERLAKVRLDELQVQHEVCKGQGGCMGLSAGHTFTLAEHPRDDQNREYLVTAVSLKAEAGEYASGGGGGVSLRCGVEAIDKTQTFRAARSTPRPVVQGPQTAMVTGPGGEEIHVDKHGRVKVQFHWDRYGKADQDSSCWVRVAQVWAGKQWGGIYTPRIGQEVIVEFLEGDPDRPIITGRVYNAEAKPPYELPAEKTKSTLKSASSKGSDGFNEIRFEDKKGEEQLFIHAEKDFELRIKNDSYETVTRDQHVIVENDHHLEVKNNRNETVAVDHCEEIGGSRNLKVKADEIKEVTGAQSLKVDGDVKETFGANHEEKTTSNYKLKATEIKIEADAKIELIVGGSKITIDSSKIEIKAPMITVKGDAQVEVSSPATKAEGSGMLTLKGGVVKIN